MRRTERQLGDFNRALRQLEQAERADCIDDAAIATWGGDDAAKRSADLRKRR